MGSLYDLSPPGVPGELVIAGKGLARGYWNLPEETEKSFVPDPFYPGERMYLTGDLVKWTEDGELIYLAEKTIKSTSVASGLSCQKLKHSFLHFQMSKKQL
ncbi:hypothetical protein ACEQPO_02360 [Bacillus sp. SL00103]